MTDETTSIWNEAPTNVLWPVVQYIKRNSNRRCGDFKQLRSLNKWWCTETSKAVEEIHFCEYGNATELGLSISQRFTEAKTLTIPSLCWEVLSIDDSGVRYVADKSLLIVFNSIRSIHSLEITDPPEWEKEDLADVQPITSLKSLTMEGGNIPGLFAKLPNLTHLSMDHCRYYHSEVDWTALTKLRSLYLGETSPEPTDFGYTALTNLKELRITMLKGPNVSTLSTLTGLTQLHILKCYEPGVQLERVVSNLTNLQDLAIAGMNNSSLVITSEDDETDVPRLVRFPRSLKSLDVLGSLRCDDPVVDDLSQLTNLTKLLLAKQPDGYLDNVELNWLVHLKEMRDLTIMGDSVSPLGFVWLTGLTHLEAVMLHFKRIHSCAINDLLNLKRLKVLALDCDELVESEKEWDEVRKDLMVVMKSRGVSICWEDDFSQRVVLE